MPRYSYALRGWLVLIFLANTAGLVSLAASMDSWLTRYAKLNESLIVLLMACGILSLIAVVLIWTFRRSGVLLLVFAYTVMLVINVYFEAPLEHTILGPVGLVILSGLLYANRSGFLPPADEK